MDKIFLIREKTSKIGGAEVYLSRLSKALGDNNVEHQIVNSVFPKFLPSWLRVILFNLQVCLTKKNKFYFSLERIICPDVYRAGDGVHKVFLSIENKSKLNPLHPVYLYLEKRCFNNSKCIIANSNMIKDEIINTYSIDPSKIDVVYNGIEPKKVDHKRSFNKLSKEFGLDKDVPILLYVGSGFKRKGVEEFLEIIANLKVKNFQAFIIGKEKNLGYYEQLSRDLKVDKKVIFTGARQDVDDFYAISDVLLFPTRYEPFSNVVLEAMSSKNAVFTTQQNGAHEVLDKEYIMTHSKDFSVASKIDQLLKDIGKLNNIKKDNKLRADKLSIELNMQNTIATIKQAQND